MTSGAYRQGFCFAEGGLEPGMLTVVVSTYEPGLKVKEVCPVYHSSFCLNEL